MAGIDAPPDGDPGCDGSAAADGGAAYDGMAASDPDAGVVPSPWVELTEPALEVEGGTAAGGAGRAGGRVVLRSGGAHTTDMEKYARDFSQDKLELVNSYLPEQRILSSAHTALLLPPDDPHYGEKGEYSNCTHHYPDDMEKYTGCLKHPEKVIQGEII